VSDAKLRAWVQNWIELGPILEAIRRRELEAMTDECGKTNRDPGEIEVTCGLGKPTLDFVKRMQDLGVSRLIMPPPAFDKDGLRAGLEKIGNELISKC